MLFLFQAKEGIRYGECAMVLRGESFWRLRKRPMVTCGWVRNSVCIALMVCARFRGSRRRVRVSLPILFTACWWREMGRYGLAPRKGVLPGRTENLRTIRSLTDS